MIFVLRPEPGLQSTLQLAREMGLAAIGMPLFEVMPIAWDTPDAGEFDALLLGSANAVRHGGKGLEAYRDLPVHAVGKATAEAAREAGFTVATVGEGGLQAVLDANAQPTRYLRLGGVETVPLEPGRHTIAKRAVYEVRPLPITGSAQIGLRTGTPCILLHSAAAARHFGAEIDRVGLARSAMHLACIGPRVADAAGRGWAAVSSAAQPNDTALLALARDMCH
ncbi:uroporphyrinogen-III synthase [Aurantiacibacter poecillastricola]|uniref:uroporphyrinogen-III synthase n=1 Tax=Aurantiacibacter poecillastricola TaxID=3064385 RepID=UPI00273D01E6|nr:uroporphyrinogen-III synthase [Aurantiacibacter sp. 219JJ12-13]MDP5261435.1 uroporphyrinogen-III synthase [Aurantiacibacter sp. 219JJ12-13]